MELSTGDRVILYGLGDSTGLSRLNLLPAAVAGAVPASVDLDEPVAVRLLGGEGVEEHKVMRRNLLRAKSQSDRRTACLLQTIYTHAGLRICTPMLAQRLAGCDGLVLAIASFAAATRTFPHQFTGYMGGLVPEYCFYDAKGASRAFTPCSTGTHRIDCGAAVVGVGQIAFAGGCGAHPTTAAAEEEEEEEEVPVGEAGGEERERGFFRSAVMYDSLLDEWQSLPRMRCRRHGAAAVCIGRRLFVLGGQYVHNDDADEDDGGGGGDDDDDDEKRSAVRAGERRSRTALELFSETLDLDDLASGWSLLPAESYQHLGQAPRQAFAHSCAFFPAGVLDGRIVARLECGLPSDGGVTGDINELSRPNFVKPGAGEGGGGGGGDRLSVQRPNLPVSRHVPIRAQKRPSVLSVTVAFDPTRPEDGWRRVACGGAFRGMVTYGQQPTWVWQPREALSEDAKAYEAWEQEQWLQREAQSREDGSATDIAPLTSSSSLSSSLSLPPPPPPPPLMSSRRPRRGFLNPAQGHGASSATHGREWVLAGGRPSDALGRTACAFRFTPPPPPPPPPALRGEGADVERRVEGEGEDAEDPRGAREDEWWHGEWRSLPGLNVPRVGATLVSMHGRLYAMGGCDEGAREFCDGAEEFLDWAPDPTLESRSGDGSGSGNSGGGGGSSDDDADGSWWEVSKEKEQSKPGSAPQGVPAHWAKVGWFRMPRALHAHTTAGLPRLLLLP